ncbi:hypothetical protein J7E96_08600 [Streptomyces sp. ISL-96]|uniref:hypothetical protein n=1 Tax=Streptomyces sp. ISL-96 TaxID=2819191 RepID=UPI001BE60983|nr:hypothetical protein [Streptomyces sp. ISL-96]MBT2488582.1 hypothetical protein [Streptomyces sp. ISL-96]
MRRGFTAALQRWSAVVSPPQHADEEEWPHGVLPHGAGAILRLFEHRLHPALEFDRELELDTFAVRTALGACARRILDDGGVKAGGAAAEPAPHGPGLPALSPELTSATGSLLIECALLHVLAGTRPRRPLPARSR